MTPDQHANLFRLARELYGALQDYGAAPEFSAKPGRLQAFTYRPRIASAASASLDQPENLFVGWSCGTVLMLPPPEKGK